MSATDPTTGGEYPGTFLDALHQAATAVGWQFHKLDAAGLVFVDRDGVPQNIGLEGFYHRFRDYAPGEWPDRIADHFHKVIAITKTEANDDLNSQADHLLVRVGRPYPKTPPISVWSRPLPDTDLAVMLVS